MHTDKCPRLKAVSYREDGLVERIEFYPDIVLEQRES